MVLVGLTVTACCYCKVYDPLRLLWLRKKKEWCTKKPKPPAEPEPEPPGTPEVRNFNLDNGSLASSSCAKISVLLYTFSTPALFKQWVSGLRTMAWMMLTAALPSCALFCCLQPLCATFDLVGALLYTHTHTHTGLTWQHTKLHTTAPKKARCVECPVPIWCLSPSLTCAMPGGPLPNLLSVQGSLQTCLFFCLAFKSSSCLIFRAPQQHPS